MKKALILVLSMLLCLPCAFSLMTPKLTKGANDLLLASTEQMKLSNRAYTRILKVARTIADLDGFEDIHEEQIAEAVQYRTLDRKYWG